VRSTRATTARSPTTRSSSASAVPHASDRAVWATSSGSAAAGATNVRGATTPTSAQQPTKAASHRRAWKPQARARAMPPTTSAATSAGRARSAPGSQKGVWLKWMTSRSGRSAASTGGTSARWRSCTATSAPSGASSTTAAAKARLTRP
jgi:hypothetical protein